MLFFVLIGCLLTFLQETEGRARKNQTLVIADEEATKATRFPRSLTASEDGKIEWTTILQTKDGKLRGKILKSRKNKGYVAFRGIQYARVVGRFQASVAPLPWENIKDALDFGYECPQCETCGYNLTSTHEDCLYLNVYVPDLRPTQKELAVLLFIHEGYMRGSGSIFGADYFMDEGIILVTLNYRLGVLGFLNTQDGIVPGNNGLRDIVMALKWIEQNIKDFTGDPIRVTVFGETGSIAHLLILSPATQDLIRSAIIPSQSALDVTVLSNPAKSNKLLADKVNCTEFPTSAFVKCLTKLDLEVLVAAQKNISTTQQGMRNYFGPSVDSSLTGVSKRGKGILPETPYQLIEKGAGRDIPMIIGMMENEGLPMRAVVLKNKTWLEKLSNNGSAIVELLHYGEALTNSDTHKIGKEIKRIYFGKDKIAKNHSFAFQHLLNQVWSHRPIRLAAELHARWNPNVYLYFFMQRGAFSIASYYGIYKEGPTNGDDIYYLFPDGRENKLWPVTSHPSDIEFSKKFVALYASFVKTGKPSSYWKTKWEPLATNYSLGDQIPWYTIHDEPERMGFQDFSEATYKHLDELLSYYESPQISWRATEY